MRRMRFGTLGFCGLIVVMFLAEAPFSGAQDQSKAVVVHATKRASLPPLDTIVPIPPRSGRLSSALEEELPMDEQRATIPVEDLVQQGSLPLTHLSTNSGLNFLGLGTGLSGFVDQTGSPDTNAAVGPTQIVQWVNYSFAVFNKSDGSLAYGPAGSNTWWKALGGPCYNNDNLDPIAQYDKLAERWVMMMPVFKAPFYLCVAVSQTSDAITGGWNLYSFPIPGKVDPDYPKLGVWPDAYYVTYNQFSSAGFLGAAACALDRESMLTGAAATMQCFTNINTSYGSLLPGDLDGTTPPPANSPDYFLNFSTNGTSLDLWQFHVDWTRPTDSTFTGPTVIPVAPFTEGCGGGACIPQAGTSQLLNSYGDRVMYRLPYRNFGDHASLLVNHTIYTGTGSSSNIGIRWYELQNPGAGFGLYQQGTYAPDSSSRWMGSIAMDKVGDIALGYSISSSTMSPSLRYTGRMPSDPLGQMESEIDLLTSLSIAHGSQTTYDNWGDYSSMAIDPTDDCTFWYTTEYQPTLGYRWSTRIASFSFPSCARSSSWAIVNKASNPDVKSLTIPATGTGNLIAVAIMFNGSTSVAGVSDNAHGGSNTYVSAGARATVGALSVEIWYVKDSKPGATVVSPRFTGSPSHVEITSWEVSGVSHSAPDATNTASGNVVANTSGPAVTTTQFGDFIISVLFSAFADFTRISSGNEFTNDFATSGNGWAHITSTSSQPATHQASWFTPAPSGKYCASTVAFLSAR